MEGLETLERLSLEPSETAVMPRFNYDILACILDHTNIGRVATTLMYFARHLDTESREKLFLNRNDPRRIFSEFTDNPEELLEAMRNFKIVLSGSRAVNYFVPGSASSSSDYDFFGEDSHHGLQRFALYLEDQGIEWIVPDDSDEEDGYAEEEGVSLMRGILVRGGKDIHLQLIWRLKHSGSRKFSTKSFSFNGDATC
jgi:hypothetical protein